MQLVEISGTKDGANVTFTLATAPTTGLPFFIVYQGLIQRRVLASPGINEFSISGATITMGLAPLSGDSLYAFIQSDASKSLQKVALIGALDGSNLNFAFSGSIATGSAPIVIFNGIVQDQVSASPGTNEFLVSGQVVTLGQAPNASSPFNDEISMYIETNAQIFFRALTTLGGRDGSNTVFTIVAPSSSADLVPNYFVILNGLVINLTTATSFGPLNYSLSTDGLTMTLGFAPTSTSYFEVYAAGLSTISVSTALLSLREMSGRLQVLVNGQIDEEEARMCLDEQWRAIIGGHQWSFTKTDGIINIVPQKTAGTVTLTQDSNFVVGSGITVEESDIGSFLVLNAQPYRIVGVDVEAGAWIIEAQYTGATASAQTYQLFKNQYELSPDVTYILYFVGPDWHLQERTEGGINIIDADREVTGDPIYYSYIPHSDSRVSRIEFWPVPVQRRYFRYVGLKRSTFRSTTELIADVSHVLLKQAAEMACQIVAAKAASSGVATSGSSTIWMQMADRYAQRAGTEMMQYKKIDRLRMGKDRSQYGDFTSPLRGRSDLDLRFIH